jgi:hypothetical protein
MKLVQFDNYCRSDSSSSDVDDDSNSDDEWLTKSMGFIQSTQNTLFGTTLLMSEYFLTYVDKNDARTLEQSGFGWTMETLKTPCESHKMFKMNAKLFYKLHDLLVSSYGLELSLHMNSIESLPMFLVVCGHGTSYSGLHGILRHSSETISRKIGKY